jgi:hypothetical protein
MKKLTYNQKTKLYALLCVICFMGALLTFIFCEANEYHFGDPANAVVIFTDGTEISSLWFKGMVGVLTLAAFILFILAVNKSYKIPKGS